jgi:hypothetical protein
MHQMLMKSNLILQEYVVHFCNMAFMSKNPPVVVKKYLVQLNTNPETMTTSIV